MVAAGEKMNLRWKKNKRAGGGGNCIKLGVKSIKIESYWIIVSEIAPPAASMYAGVRNGSQRGGGVNH